MGTLLYHFLLLKYVVFTRIVSIIVIIYFLIVNTPLSTFIMFQFFFHEIKFGKLCGKPQFECLPKK